MIKRNILFITSLAVMFGAVLFAQPALAQCGGAKTSVIKCSSTDGAEGAAIFEIISQVVSIMSIVIGLAAVGSVIAGAIFYSMSGDNPENIKKAKTIWVNTLIGLGLYAFFVAITNFLIPGGVFS